MSPVTSLKRVADKAAGQAKTVAPKAWGETAPDWIVVLAREVDRSSQAKVARRLGRSGSLVSSLLAGKYEGSLEVCEELVRGVFMGGEVTCPALGRLPMNECHGWREKTRNFVPTNTLRATMFRACMRCPRHKKEDGHEN